MKISGNTDQPRPEISQPARRPEYENQRPEKRAARYSRQTRQRPESQAQSAQRVENWDKAAATIAATAFSTKWINIVQAHLTYVIRTPWAGSPVIGCVRHTGSLAPGTDDEVDMNHARWR